MTEGSLTEMYARLGEKYGDIIFMRTVLDAPVVAIRHYDVVKVVFLEMNWWPVGAISTLSKGMSHLCKRCENGNFCRGQLFSTLFQM